MPLFYQKGPSPESGLCLSFGFIQPGIYIWSGRLRSLVFTQFSSSFLYLHEHTIIYLCINTVYFVHCVYLSVHVFEAALHPEGDYLKWRN